jgi:hypothetical protein
VYFAQVTDSVRFCEHITYKKGDTHTNSLCVIFETMKFKYSILLVGLLALTSSFGIGYDWAQAWVNDIVISKVDLSKTVRKQITQKELTLIVLTKKDLTTTPSNGNTYLRCYLINNTDTTTLIGRSDATITGFSTEVFKDKVWQHFQRPMGSGCGNSYWTQKLETQNVLSIQLDHAENGPIKIPFRVKFNHNDTIIYSNVITVDIDKKNFDRVGKSKK